MAATCLFLLLAAEGGFTWGDTADGQLLLTRAGRPVLQYNKSLVQPPEGTSPLYARNGYLHPVWNTAGRIVTDGYPADHLHQRGFFFAWTRTVWGRLRPDFWNLQSGTGRTVGESIERAEVVDGRAELVTLHRHEAKVGEAWVTVLRERWELIVHPPEPGDDSYAIDLTTRLENVTETPLELPQYHYGGMAFRGNGYWIEHRDAVRALTSEGFDRLQGNATRARWCLMGGDLPEGYAGATIFDHPGNFSHPTGLRIHPTMPYFAVAPCVTGAFAIRPGEPLILRYRLIIHTTEPTREALDGQWAVWTR